MKRKNKVVLAITFIVLALSFAAAFVLHEIREVMQRIG